MHHLFEDWIRPLLDAARPSTLLEVGVCEGATTFKILEWCAAHDAHLTSLEPAAWKGAIPDELKPPFGEFVFYRGSPKRQEAFVPTHVEQALARGWGSRWTCLKTTSLVYLASPEFSGFDAYFLDGDHNYYTLSNELRLLEPKLRPGNLVLLHDVGLKWGREDSFYDPDTVPPEGLNSEKRGVLTAIEDFLREHGGRKEGPHCAAEDAERIMTAWAGECQRNWTLSRRLRAGLALARGRDPRPLRDDAYLSRVEAVVDPTAPGSLYDPHRKNYRFEIVTRKHHGLGVITVGGD